jgi:hypothetical protein
MCASRSDVTTRQVWGRACLFTYLVVLIHNYYVSK